MLDGLRSVFGGEGDRQVSGSGNLKVGCLALVAVGMGVHSWTGDDLALTAVETATLLIDPA